MGNGQLRVSPIELAAAPHRYDLITWELSHLPDKWVHKLKSLLPWNSRSRGEGLTALQEFFLTGERIHDLERELVDLLALPSDEEGNPHSPTIADRSEHADALSRHLDTLRSGRSDMKARAEEALESEIGSILAKEGLSTRIGITFPPVDVSLVSPPRLLIVSPRDRIERIKTVLLKPGMKVEDMEELEEKFFREQDLAALVAGVGGVATFPTIVREDSSLRQAAITASHEWLHHYWFFRPFGWKFWSWTSEMNTLNETAASLAGQELGDLVYRAISGEQNQQPDPPDSLPPEEALPPKEPEEPDEEGFDFNREMRKTRLRVDELLGQGTVEEAENYMEERRKLFVDNGFHIRKLNQAYFAFHGTYAASPASVSPIGDEVDRLRSMTDSVGEFVRTMSRFGSYQEFQDYLSGISESVTMDPHPG